MTKKKYTCHVSISSSHCLSVNSQLPISYTFYHALSGIRLQPLFNHFPAK